MRKVMALGLILTGCVSPGVYQKKVVEARDANAKLNSCESSLANLKQDLKQKNDRLRKFNQLNEQDEIRWEK